MYFSKYDKEMNLYKIILLFLFTFMLNSCANYQINKSQDVEKYYFSSTGFALIYDDELYIQKVVNKKINNDDIRIMHNLLKPNTPIKIFNPENSKSIVSKIYKRANYPNIFNAVITKKIASALELDVNNPYIEIIEIKKNKTFIAKESNMYDEEKNVEEKAPVNEIEMNDLSKQESAPDKKKIKKYNFIIVINDFYYIDSANNLKNELEKKTNLKNITIKKINDNKYRLFAGPFKNFNALKTSYISLNNLGFNALNVYKE